MAEFSFLSKSIPLISYFCFVYKTVLLVKSIRKQSNHYKRKGGYPLADNGLLFSYFEVNGKMEETLSFIIIITSCFLMQVG